MKTTNGIKKDLDNYLGCIKSCPFRRVLLCGHQFHVYEMLKLTRHFQKFTDSKIDIIAWSSAIFYLPGWS